MSTESGADATTGTTASTTSTSSATDARAWRARAGTILAHPATGAAILFLAFFLTRRDVWGLLTKLPPSTFEGFSIFVRALEYPRQAITVGLCVAFAIFARKLKWSDLEHGRILRTIVIILVASQAWVASLYEYNLVVDRAHVLDRLVVIGLAAATAWRPAFLPAFLAAALIMIAQATAALSALGWTNMRLFLDALILFSMFIVVHRLLRVPVSSLFFVMLAMIGAAYFGPAIDKTEIGPEWYSWHVENDVANIAAAGYANGWLPWLGDERAAAIVKAISSVAVVLGIGTFLIEAAGLAVFAHRRLAMWLCLGVFILHAGIFTLTGILFWKWMLVDGSMFWLLWKRPQIFAWPWWMRIAGTVLVLLTPWTFKPQVLAWWDTRLNQVLTVEVQDDQGTWRPMSPLTYAPFDLPFAQQHFTEILDVPKKVGTFGATMSSGLYRKLQAARSKGDVDRLFKSRPAALDAKKAKAFDKFVVRTAQTLNAHDGEPPLGWLPHAPAHIIVVRKDAWDGQPIVAARVRFKEIFFDGERFQTFDDRIVREIPIPMSLATTSTKSKGKPAAPKVEKPAARDLKSITKHEVVDRGAAFTFEGACDVKDEDVVTLALLGDMKLHKPLSVQGLTSGYDTLWSEVRDFIAAADVTYANLEGTLDCCRDVEGNERGDPGKWDDLVLTSSTKGGLNFHPSMADGLKQLGIDVLSTANNHSLDRGAVGVGRTLDVLDKVGLLHTGTRRNDGEAWHVVTDAKGLRIAWVACTEWTNRKEKDAAALVLNCTDERDEVLALVKKLAADANVDAVVLTPHGSREDTIVPDERLLGLAREAAEAGATLVVTSHPHNMQTWQMFTTKKGRRVPFVFGRGNYLTAAAKLENTTSTIVNVGLARDPGTKKARIVGLVHTPIYQVTQKKTRDAAERRFLVFVDEPPGLDAAGIARRASFSELDDARALILARYGTARLHPPTLPLRVNIECARGSATVPPPLAGDVGEACVDDTMCAAELACVPHAEGIGLCSRACETDADCAGPDGAWSDVAGAACVVDDVLAPDGGKLCLQTSDAAGATCRLVTSSVDRGGQRVCAPGAAPH